MNVYIGENIKFLRSKSGMSQEELAKKLGYKSYTTITKWESGVSEPTLKVVNKIANLFGISVNDLCYTRLNHPECDNSKKRSAVIKVYGHVAAGIPIEMIEDIVDQEEITEDMALKGTYFGIKIKGDSMIPNICDGDTVIVRRQDDAENGETVIATVNGSDATCKRLRKHKDGIELIANNPNYEPMYYSNEEIENKPVRILGKVVELRRKL